MTGLWLLTVATIPALGQTVLKGDEYPGFIPGKSLPGSEWAEAIKVQAPELRSDVKGDVKVEFKATGMSVARALCWQQPTADTPNPAGHDTQVTPDIKLDAEGKGSFVFPADKYPNGPIIIRILANTDDMSKRDIFELQLFNKGGVVWNQGIPKNDPPAAAGMKLLFADDFDSDDLSISTDGKGPDGKPVKYCAHTPWKGDFSGWQFADPTGDLNPFSRVGTFLKIHASKRADGKSSSGLISSAGYDGTGIRAKMPFYMECRFIAQSEPGTWPAFWTNTYKDPNAPAGSSASDELDVIEGYGGRGKGNPNFPSYNATTHFWGQKEKDGKNKPDAVKTISMLDIGNQSSWSTTFHTYGIKVTETDTIYYLDDNEVFRHPTGDISKTQTACFLINYAIGGNSGWKIHLERMGNASDMYVDYVRVYQGQ